MAALPSCFLGKEILSFILMNPASWVNWVPEPCEPSSLGFVALATNPANPAKTQLLMF